VSGRLVYRAPEAHVCDPGGPYSATVGSIFACDCGIWWVLRKDSGWQCWREMNRRQIRRHKKLGGTV
jgi:hypothetical protein